MSGNDDLIPRPPIVREHLARARREAARLRRLLRLSEAAAFDRAEQAAKAAPEPPSPIIEKGVAR
ncbi:hypothetical protein [Paludisphaera sp.]|uniref:hypothetical protein n=1 Tax=Paludisphaera sp. TaxID=2017432 RepID=UPI00301D5939